MGIFDYFKKRKKIKAIVEMFKDRESDKQILNWLKQEGDNAEISRPVSHYCYFKKKDKLNSFLALPKIVQTQKEPIYKGIGIILVMDCTMREEDIFSQIDEITALTVEAGGEYDGWETMVQK